MPCIKCNNGKWKYGKHGKCVFDTLQKCKDAAAAIHAKPKKTPEELEATAEDLAPLFVKDCGCNATIGWMNTIRTLWGSKE